MRRNGFSLIELIVVITIILVVTTIAAVSYSGTNNRARDSRRMADLEKVRMALELYRQQNSSYPAATSSLVPNFLQAWPNDPRGYSYYYLRGSTVYTYTLDARMEDVGVTGNYGSNCGGICNYRVTNP